MPRKKSPAKLITASAVFITLILAAGWLWQSRPGYVIESGFWAVEKAWMEKRSGQMVEVQGRVVRVLQDDKSDPDNQKFVIRMKNGQAVLVVHNIPRGGEVPLSVNHEVTVRGEYLWTETGGTIRFTRRDNSLERRHGWIDHLGERYE